MRSNKQTPVAHPTTCSGRRLTHATERLRRGDTSESQTLAAKSAQRPETGGTGGAPHDGPVDGFGSRAMMFLGVSRISERTPRLRLQSPSKEEPVLEDRNRKPTSKAVKVPNQPLHAGLFCQGDDGIDNGSTMGDDKPSVDNHDAQQIFEETSVEYRNKHLQIPNLTQICSFSQQPRLFI